ncbi:MAG: UDP-N-acetylmuramoyl-tripeptide--D-alanyl-D-alanine ligase [Bacilli bacterium]|nr:UDP-N-acetylmuramoyl-tripeptide--D-alanyl-D-alanine ligase [Bacilli bacterium]
MIYVRDIINLCNGKLFSNIENLDLECINFCTDTRKLNEGDIYVGIKGDTFNGNNFYKEAFSKGASLCLLDNDTKIDDTYRDKNIILVDNTISSLQELAKYKRSLYDIPVIAVTGSVGKTSVKDIIYSVLKSKYRVLSTKGNLNNHIGVPLTILELNDHDALVVEMGMNHFGELHILSNIVRPTIAVITNIGTAHIGNLGSRENILKAKLEILDGMDDGILIINNDNDMLRTVKYNNLITVGIENESDYIAKEIQDKVFASNFYINNQYIELPVGSKAFIYNALFAYAVGTKLGISSEEISNSLKSFTLTPHRLELIKTDSINIIDDTYNASLDSVKNGLELLGKVNGRKVFIFADILELDEYGENIHKEIGNIIIENNIDLLITVGKLSKYTYEVVKNNNTECYYFESNGQLLQDIDSILKDGDTILVKGSNGMKLIEVVNYLKNK